MTISITNITDKFKLKFKRLSYVQGTKVTITGNVSLLDLCIACIYYIS